MIPGARAVDLVVKGGRVVPDQVTASCRSSAANRSSFSSNNVSYCDRSWPNSGNDSVKEPRPRTTSARPPDAASRVEKRWNTRMGSSELRTVTAEPSRMRLVRPAMAARTTSGGTILNWPSYTGTTGQCRHK